MEKQEKNLGLIEGILAKELDPAFARRARLIFENLDVKPRMRILEAGCGRGFYTSALITLFEEITVVGIDTNKEYLRKARNFIAKKDTHMRKKISNRLKYKQADARKLPFENKSFNRAICSEVLEHIKEDGEVIKEIYRVLKPYGKAIFTVPNKDYPFLWDPLNWVLEKLFKKHIPSNIWWLAGIWAGHVRLYSESELVLKLEDAGFKIDKIWRSTRYCLPFSHFLLYGVGKNLVEIGLAGGSVNRFSQDVKPSIITKLLKLPLFFFDSLNKNSFSKNSSFVNIIVKASKIEPKPSSF